MIRIEKLNKLNPREEAQAARYIVDLCINKSSDMMTDDMYVTKRDGTFYISTK